MGWIPRALTIQLGPQYSDTVSRVPEGLVGSRCQVLSADAGAPREPSWWQGQLRRGDYVEPPRGVRIQGTEDGGVREIFSASAHYCGAETLGVDHPQASSILNQLGLLCAQRFREEGKDREPVSTSALYFGEAGRRWREGHGRAQPRRVRYRSSRDDGGSCEAFARVL